MPCSLVSRGRRGTLWHSNMFHNVSSFCVAGAILLKHFQTVRSSFRGRRSTLDVSIVISRGRRSTLDVSCCVFFANRVVRVASSGDKVQTLAGVAFCEMWWNIDGSLARNIDFDVVILRFIGKRRKTSILKLRSVKIGGSLAFLLVLSLQHVTSQVSGFPLASPCIWRKLQNLSFLKVSKQVVMSFCVAGAILLCPFQKMSCSFRGRRSTLETSIVILRGKRSTSDVSHCVLHTPHFTLHTLHFTLHTSHSTLHTPHFTLNTPHSTLYTLHSTFYTPHFTLYTPHSTLYTPHSALYTPHSTLYTPHSTLCTPPSSAFHSLQCTGTVTGEKCRIFK